MKIMFINDVGLDNQNGNNHLTISMLLKFLNSGIAVYYVAAHSEGKNEDIPKELLKHPLFEYDIINKKATKKTALVKRYLNSLKFEFDAKKKWKKRIKDMDIVLLQSHYTAFLTAKLLKKYKKKIVFNIYDIFPGISFKSSGLPNKLIYSVFLQIQKSVYKNSNIVFTLTEDTKESLIKLGVLKEKIVVVPNWFDETKVCELDYFENSFALEHNPLRKKCIQYAGSLGTSYDFECVLELAKRFENRNDIFFQFVGGGLKLNLVKNRASELKLSNVEFVEWQPVERLSEVYSSCTIQIVPLISEVIFNSYPSKILPLMGCKRTAVIFVDKESLFFNEINNNKVAICIDIGNIEKAHDAILKLCDNEALRNEYEKNAFNYVFSKYTMDVNTNKMIESFNKLMNTK